MRISLTINNIENILLKELARPWIYCARHFSLAFGNSEIKLTAHKVNDAAQQAIKDANKDAESDLIPTFYVTFADRVVNIVLGILEALPIINYIMALYERTYMDKLEIINDDKPIDQLRTDKIITRSKTKMTDSIYDNFETIHRIFTEAGIKYSVSSGSQLGATRHKGIIPWDDDGDLDVELSNRDAILALQDKFEAENYGFYIQNDWGIIKIFNKNGDDQFDGLKIPFIDVFFLKKDDQNHYVYAGEKSAQSWGSYHVTQEEWDSVTEVEFGHLKVNGIPADKSDSYVKRLYGENCMTTGVKTHEHEDFTFNQSAERVRLADFEPARHSKNPKV